MYSIRAPKPSHTTLKLSLTAGGLTIGLGLAYLYYQSRKKSTSTDLDVSKETIIRILKEFRKEFYPVFKNLSLASVKIQNEYKTRYKMPPEQLKEILYTHLVEENPVFKPQILDIEDRVYSKYDVINRSEFQRLCNELAKGDLTIRNLMSEIKDLFKMAINGTLKPPNITLPADISADKVLEVYKETVKQVLRAVTDYVSNYIQEHGRIAINDEGFHAGIQALSIDQIKSRIIKASGLEFPEDVHPQQAFTFAINKFSRELPAFSEKVNRIESVNQEIMGKMFMPAANFAEIVDELDRFDQLVLPPQPILALAEPNNLVQPVEVHVNKDASFTIHVDDHVHIERSANGDLHADQPAEHDPVITHNDQHDDQSNLTELTGTNHVDLPERKSSSENNNHSANTFQQIDTPTVDNDSMTGTQIEKPNEENPEPSVEQNLSSDQN